MNENAIENVHGVQVTAILKGILNLTQQIVTGKNKPVDRFSSLLYPCRNV